VDTSQAALDAVLENARLNGLDEAVKTEKADAFDLLSRLVREKQRFDLLILDPPAFAKSHNDLSAALKGYREINLKAMNLRAAGGVLVTCSCSQVVDEFRFRQVVAEAAVDADRRLYEREFLGQPPDHPSLVGHAPSRYLKCGIYYVE
jgi:23S rRNA (cytosine1962-C5)-methyltransferase